MSRVGKAPVKIAPGVKVAVRDGSIFVEGPKGKLNMKLPEGVVVKADAATVTVSREGKATPRREAQLHGVIRTQIQNMVTGCAAGFQKHLDIVGVGYRAAVKGQVLSLTIGYSHPIEYKLPTGVTAAVENNTHVVLSSADKMLLGLTAAKVRGFKEPEPYQGKGIKYTDERIVRKAGKAAGAK